MVRNVGDGPSLVVTDVHHSFFPRAGEVAVLKGVSASFAGSSWTAIMGPSGSGKSTLLYCCAGLVRATSGTVILDGTDVGAASANELTRMRQGRVGFVFQSFNLVPALTAAQNTLLPGLFARRRVAWEKVKGVLSDVGLGDRLDSRPEELSGGQQQRVAIARALLMEPAVVFADEPTGALDTRTGAEVMDQFQELVETGAAIVMVTHDPAVASRADRVLFLDDGRIIDEVTGATAREIADRVASLDEGAA